MLIPNYTEVFGMSAITSMNLLVAFIAIDIYGCSSINDYFMMRLYVLAKVRTIFTALRICKKR